MGFDSVDGEWGSRMLSDDELLTVADVAALLKVNQVTVRAWID
jgi:hypothetical protein